MKISADFAQWLNMRRIYNQEASPFRSIYLTETSDCILCDNATLTFF